MEFLPTGYTAFALIAFASSLVSAVFGIGTALLLLSLGAAVLPIKETIALSTVLFLAAGLSKSALFRNAIDWRITAWVTLSSLPLAYIGATLVDTLPVEWLRRMLSAMVLIYLLVTQLLAKLSFTPGRAGLLAGSCLYGFLSGLLGSGNLVKALMFRELVLGKEAFVGMMAATSLLVNVAKLTAYTTNGLLHRGQIGIIITLLCIAVLSSWAGREVLHKLPLQNFQRGVSLVLAVAAINLLFT